jgi:ABC-type nickel/cobalt efflux system permease component RcnA
LFGALREVRNVEIVSYTLILLIGLWRLWAGLTGRLHEHGHGDRRGDPSPPSRAAAPPAGWLPLTAAGIAPCAGR